MTARPDEVVACEYVRGLGATEYGMRLASMIRDDVVAGDFTATLTRIIEAALQPADAQNELLSDQMRHILKSHNKLGDELQSANARLAEAETAFSAALITVGNQDEQIAVLTERLAAAEHALTQTFDFPDDTFERGDDELFIITVTGRHLKLVHEAIRRAAAGEGDEVTG